MAKKVRVKRAAKRITNKVSPQRQVTINMADFQFIGSGQSPSSSLTCLVSGNCTSLLLLRLLGVAGSRILSLRLLLLLLSLLLWLGQLLLLRRL